MSEQVRLTPDGEAMAAELAFGHNPLAYLCSERADSEPFDSEAVCVRCSDGFEALHWKRRALAAEAKPADQ